MRLLLDTHVFIWWNGSSGSIAPSLRAAIAQAGNSVVVSAASVWEIAIKRAIGKFSFSGVVVDAVRRHRFELLPITAEHAEYAGALPQHHGDPFDRMLIAQAHLEGLVLGTQDPKIRPYQVAILGL